MTVFYLGAHHANWLETAGVPLFVSRRTLAPMRTLPRAVAPWALDSGGFTELHMHGRWRLSAREYADIVRRVRDEVGMMQWAAPQDWMCEPDIVAGTGLSVAEHQQRTLDNYLELRALAPDLPVVPVLQGWTMGDYFDHAEAYDVAGVDLFALPLVGVGTICRRQNTTRIAAMLAMLHQDGLRMHGFGVKLDGLRRAAPFLASADSAAWSYNARRNPRLPGHTHKSCANCIEYALDWRTDVQSRIDAACALRGAA